MGANYYYHTKDAVTMTRLVADLGGFGARAYIKSYSGKPHIIIKGHAGLRTLLTGTKYGVKNPKVISIGLGKTGAISAAKQGGILTVVVLSIYRVVDYFLKDQATLSQLIGSLATDVVKVGISTGAAIVAATIAGATTFAVGPIVAVVVVGVGMTWFLNKVDNQLGVTNRVIAGLDELGKNVENYLTMKKDLALNNVGKAVEEVIDYAIESVCVIAINWVRKTIDEYLSPFQRVN